jgi:hypothetical protein
VGPACHAPGPSGESSPGSHELFRDGLRVIGTGENALIRRCAEVRQYSRAINGLPPETVVGEAVVLIPADFDGEEIFQAGLLDELWKRPGIAKNVRQPESRRFGSSHKVFREE